MEHQPPSINLLDVLRGIGRHKFLILVGAVLGFAAGLGFISTSGTLYSTEAQVLIENLASPFDKVQVADNQQSTEAIDDRTIQSQMSVLRSRDLALRVVQALNLQERDEFDNLKGKSVGPLKQWLIRFGFSDDPRLMSPTERALSRYTKQLNVYQVPLSNVVAVKYSASDPATAAEVANALVNTYVTATAEAKAQPTRRAREWLSTQIDDLRKKLATSEADIETFRAQHGLLQGQTSTLGSQELSELNSQITLAESARTDAEERSREINKILSSQGSVDTSTDVLNSTNVQRLREQQVTAARRVAELSAVYLPNHPKMMAAQNDLRNIDLQIRGEALKVVEGLDQQAKIAKARENSLRARLEKMKGTTSTANLDDVKLQAMIRDSTADKALLESLLLRYADASARQDIATQPGFARVIQVADVPTSPSFPKTGPLVLLLTLAGLSLSLGLSFLMEIMAAARNLGLQAVVPPQIALAPPREMPQAREMPPPLQLQPMAAPSSEPPAMVPMETLPVGVSAEANLELITLSASYDNYGLLRAAGQVATWVLEPHGPKPIRQLALVSLGGGASDSSLASVVIARAMAAQKARVVVVDLASSKSSIEKFFGLPPGPGFIDLLAGTADFTKVINRDPSSPVHFLRFGFDRRESSAASLDQKTEAVLGALGKIYDIVLVHTGEASSRTTALLANCGAALILAPGSRQGEVARVAKALSRGGQATVQFVKLDQLNANAIKLAASA